MQTRPRHQTHLKNLPGIMCLSKLQQNTGNLILLVFIYLIAYMYVLDSARFAKGEEIIGFYLQM